ncbi:hypothetical protein BGZ70_008315 [Mortierella alpina]|uniref:RNI-like protein n=1 Tax=Mortierella alpina TaxID=64518 RepID=A0A9P6JD88_MORAP|nr:hypothetical protein BGZ70_008315 [Mortierella alpina]
MGTQGSGGLENDAKMQSIELKQIPKDQVGQSPIKDSPLQPPQHTGNIQKTVEDLHVSSRSSKPASGSRHGSSRTVRRASTTPQEAARLERVRATVRAFLNKRFSAHEYTVPRLFVVLPETADVDRPPKDSSNKHEQSGGGAATGFDTKDQETMAKDSPPVDRYRLYFLCECSPSFTHPLGSGLNHLHIAKHPGYEIDSGRLDEFFDRYGSMVLMLLIFLKHGLDPASSSVAPSQTAPDASQPRPQPPDPSDACLKKVEKISNLKRSDLPDSIGAQVELKVNRMIEYLERHQGKRHDDTACGVHGLAKVEEDNSTMADNGTVKDSHDEEVLQGLVSLADLHQLYSFLGIANVSRRLQSGQLGNLYRISNVRGQVSWVCVYHYRWTFLEKNIDEFEHWIVTRRGLFDKQSGSVMITLVSRAHTRTFCSWISNKVAPSLVEVHLKLGWKFGKKDLWRIAKALAHSTVTVLSLDGCSFAEDSSYMALHKKYDPILHLLTHGQLQSLELLRLPALFARLSQKHVKATSLKRLELGQGMEVDPKDRGSLSQLLASCSSLKELILPGFPVTDIHIQAILNGIRPRGSLVTLDLSNSQLNDGGAILLAQGLFNTNICNLDLSRNERLSDVGAARVIRAVGPRLTSLKMAHTGFGDLAAVALSRSMEGISFSNTLRDQLQLQHRLDIAALTAGHRPGVRLMIDPALVPIPPRSQQELREKETRVTCHLVYLDIEGNQCSVQGFQALAKIKARLHLVYLNLASSRGLEDEECALILGRLVSSEMSILRLACTGFGDRSAQSLAKALLEHPTSPSGSSLRTSRSCQLEELDLQACPIGPQGFTVLYEALGRIGAAACLRVLDFGHCGSLQDEVAQQFLKMLVIPNSIDRVSPKPAVSVRKWNSQSVAGSKSMTAIAALASQRNSNANGQTPGDANRADGLLGVRRGSRTLLSRSDSVPAMTTLRSEQFDMDDGDSAINAQELTRPPMAQLPAVVGFFSNLRELDLKSTLIGDETAWTLAQALVQPGIMLGTLTILEPMAMSVQGLCWIVDALCENLTVQELGIGKSNILFQSELDLFGAALVNLMEVNKRIRSLTTLGTPLGSIAKGLLLNQNLHSVYLIRSRGQFEDLQLLGQALAFNRSLLVFWMGGSDETLLGVPTPTMEDYGVEGAGIHGHSSQQQDQQQQQNQNMYRNFHLLHQQHGQLEQPSQHLLRHQPKGYQTQQQQQHQQKHQRPHRTRLYHHHGASMSQRIGSAIRTTFSLHSKESLGLGGRHRTHTQNESRTTRGGATSGSRISPSSTPTPTDHTHAINKAGPSGTAANFSLTGHWTRNPVLEGIRRNHSLIKVTLDIVSPLAALTSPLRMGTDDEMDRASGNGIGGGGMRGAGPGPGLSSSHRATTGGSNVAVLADGYQLQQLQVMQQQQLNKKIQANRKLLRDRGRVGWEELKLLGVDDDVIREVCSEV